MSHFATMKRVEENAPECVDHFCARCLMPVAEDASECAGCFRRFVGRGRFDRLGGAPPSSESIRMMQTGQSWVPRVLNFPNYFFVVRPNGLVLNVPYFVTV